MSFAYHSCLILVSIQALITLNNNPNHLIAPLVRVARVVRLALGSFLHQKSIEIEPRGECFRIMSPA